MVDNPHFVNPFAYLKSGCPVVDQDTPTEIQQCAEASLRTPRGSRTGLPTFGIRSQELLQGGANLAEIRADVSLHEERITVDPHRDGLLRDAIDNVRVDLNAGSNGNG